MPADPTFEVRLVVRKFNEKRHTYRIVETATGAFADDDVYTNRRLADNECRWMNQQAAGGVHGAA